MNRLSEYKSLSISHGMLPRAAIIPHAADCWQDVACLQAIHSHTIMYSIIWFDLVIFRFFIFASFRINLISKTSL